MSGLEQLIDRARQRKMTDAERRQQSVSFVIGNINVEGDQLSRATVTVIAIPRTEYERDQNELKRPSNQ